MKPLLTECRLASCTLSVRPASATLILKIGQLVIIAVSVTHYTLEGMEARLVGPNVFLVDLVCDEKDVLTHGGEGEFRPKQSEAINHLVRTEPCHIAQGASIHHLPANQPEGQHIRTPKQQAIATCSPSGIARVHDDECAR